MNLFTKDNLTIIIKSLAMSLFFTGTGQALNLLLPGKTWKNSLIMIVLSMIILLMDDGSLSELYKLKVHHQPLQEEK